MGGRTIYISRRTHVMVNISATNFSAVKDFTLHVDVSGILKGDTTNTQRCNNQE